MKVYNRSLSCAVVGTLSAVLALSTMGAVQAAIPQPTMDTADHVMGSWAKSGGVSTRAIAGEAQTWAEQGFAGRINGVDISSYNSPAYNKLHNAGASFAFIKASEFISGKEAYGASFYPNQKNASTNAGIIPGTYQYAKPTSSAGNVVADAAMQARGLIARSGVPRPNQLPLVCDLETAPSSLSKAALTQWALSWLQTAYTLTGRVPILYSYTSFLSSRLNPDPALVNYPLWQADYNVKKSAPGAVAGWPTANRVFWQFSSRGTVAGSNGSIDLDSFTGNSDQWSALLGYGSGNTRSLSVAKASLGRLGRALSALSLKQHKQLRQMAVPGRNRLVMRGARPLDVVYTEQSNIGVRGGVRHVWLKATFAGGGRCVMAKAGRINPTWSTVDCPNRTWRAV